MFSKQPVVAFVPARGGSKGLPHKNIYQLNNRPLIAYSIDAGFASNYVDRVVVSSDDARILEVANRFGAETLLRPNEISGDHAPTASAISHMIESLGLSEHTYIALLQPTSPLRTSVDIDNAFQLLTDGDALISVFVPEHHPMKAYKLGDSGHLQGLWSDDAPYTPRQQLPDAYMPNGALYIFSVAAFLHKNSIPTDCAIPYIMPIERSYDIDTLDDIIRIESVMGKDNGC